MTVSTPFIICCVLARYRDDVPRLRPAPSPGDGTDGGRSRRAAAVGAGVPRNDPAGLSTIFGIQILDMMCCPGKNSATVSVNCADFGGIICLQLANWRAGWA